MCPGPTFDRVYAALKGRLVSGEFGPGDHLEPSVIGSELFSSLTPVRDVLHRLVGERIVEAPRNDGFRVPLPTEAELRGLYGWRALLVELALRQSFKTARPDMEARIGYTEVAPEDRRAQALFELISGLAQLREFDIAIANVGDRLGLFHPAEQSLLDDLEQEADDLWRHYESRNWPQLRKSITLFHRRRQRAAPDLLECARRIAHNRQIGSV